MREFQINNYISLRLEDDETIIYVGGQRFRQCKYLLLNIKVNEIQSLEEIESIDELVEKYGEKSEETFQNMKYKLTPEEEFVGHCSNMQMFAESGYNTQYLRANLAFPLLKVLTEAGDPQAQKAFKKEIIFRYEKGVDTTRKFLEVEGYLNYLTLDERLDLILISRDFATLIELSEEISIEDSLSSIRILLNYIEIKKKRIVGLDLSGFELLLFPMAILKLDALKSLNLASNRLESIPRAIFKLKSLQKLWLSYNKLRFLPNSICGLKKLRQLWLDENKIRWLPNRIGDLRNLEILSLHNNRLYSLPNSISKLEYLKRINISSNKLKKFPTFLCKLKLLKELSLSANYLSKLPDCISELTLLENLRLVNNRITHFPEVLLHLTSLRELHISIKKKSNYNFDLINKLKKKGLKVIPY